MTERSGGTSQEIAWSLLTAIAASEGKLYAGSEWTPNASREYILDTYAECLEATVLGRRDYTPGQHKP